MSTTSLVVDAAQTGLAYTADLNNALAAINTCHSGTTAPTDEVVAGKLWLDTSGAHPVLKIYRNGWKSLFTLNTTTVDMSIDSITSTGVTLTGDASLGDSNKIKLGAGDDLQIYHDGTNSYIVDAGTGILKMLGNQIDLSSADGTESMATFVENGAASLFFNNVAKLATSSTGVSVTGELSATTLVGDGSSLTGVAAPVQLAATWAAGTDTTESSITAAKLLAAISGNSLGVSAISTATAGYMTLTNGMIFQWDSWSNSHGNRSFPIAFPTACLGFSYTQYSGWYENWNGYVVNKTTFTTNNTMVGTNASRASYQHMFAIGY